MNINIIHMGFFYSGGGERVVLWQARLLRERGHTVKVFSPIIRWGKCFPELLANVKPERITPPFPLPFPFREASAMVASAIIPFRVHDIADCDILLCHSQPSMWLGYRSNLLFGTPYVGYLHQLTTFIHKRPEIAGNWATQGDFLFLDGLLGGLGKPVARHLDKLCHINASKLLFNSFWTKKLFEKGYGVTGDVCYPAIHTRSYSPRRRKHEVVMACRHYPWKRIDLAFQILKELAARSMTQTPDLVVTGKETRHTSYLREAARNLGVSEHVNFTGYVTDIVLNQLFAEAKAYIQTSIYEPFGMSPLEAQSFGTPAVVWGDAGVKETVLDGETGFHATPYNILDFSEKLNTILADEERWLAMSRDAKIWATSFSWDSHVDLLEGVLDEERK